MQTFGLIQKDLDTNGWKRVDGAPYFATADEASEWIHDNAHLVDSGNLAHVRIVDGPPSE
jgi:hypothetical protein